MLRKIIIISTLSLILVQTGNTHASESNDFLVPGRDYLFDGSLSGIRTAYQLFDEGINDAACTDCDTNRELRFFRAIAGTTMLLVRDDNGSIDSVFELLKEFDIDVIGQYWAPYFDQGTLDLQIPLNQRDYYQIPDDAPDFDGLEHILDNSFVPKIDKILDDLEAITDSPEDPFRTYLSPDEIRVFFSYNSSVFNPGSFYYDPESRFLKPIEVDYGEVLLLKGILTAIKSHILAQDAYDTMVDENDPIVEKFYGNYLGIKKDFLEPYPDFLKVLPTANNPNDGKAILAQARQDWIEAINYYFDAISYIKNENSEGTDDQSDEILYLDLDDIKTSDIVNDQLMHLRDSISNDTIGSYPINTAKLYSLSEPDLPPSWNLTLNSDLLDMPAGEPGSLIALDGNSNPSPWEITNVSYYENEIMIELEYDVPGQLVGGFFSGTLNEDANSITVGTFSFWGDESGTINNLSGTLISTEIEEYQLDLNPIFGSSVRYPDPVNPRDLLPVFDQWNAPQPGTLGHELGNDATLGGVLLEMTQYDWQKMLNLQPGGMVYLDFISPWQVTVDGDVSDWYFNQIVFSDIAEDSDQNQSDVTGVDIRNVYLAHDMENLYGAIELTDEIGGNNNYRLFLSYSPDNTSSLHSLKIEISVSGENAYGNLHYMDEEYGWAYWQSITSFVSSAGQNAVEFSIPLDVMPAPLSGRYISVDSSGWNSDWYVNDGESNMTHLKIADTGTIHGTVSYDGYSGDPIFIEAHTYKYGYNQPETVVARTMVTEPGPFTLYGIGIGWEGYVTAYVPTFGFDNPFELECYRLADRIPITMSNRRVEGISLNIYAPIVLEHNIWETGNIDNYEDSDVFTFNAIEGGSYTIEIDLPEGMYGGMNLIDRNAAARLLNSYGEQPIINWTCPLGRSGQYFIWVGGMEPPYQIRMTTNMIKPIIGLSNTQIDLELPEDDSSIVTVDVFNAGIDVLDWTISGHESVSWVTSITPTIGSSASRYNKTPVDISIDAAALSIGQYNANLTISGTGDVDSVTLPVSLEVYDRVDLEEFALLAQYWQSTGCSAATPCAAADFYIDENVDIKDLLRLADCWLGKLRLRYPEISDDFETGDFSNLDWQLSGNANWQIVSDTVYEGTYAAKTGSIADGESNVIELFVDVVEYDTLSFARKVSSENGWDFLRFYVDGVLQDEWSGEQDWLLVSYPVTDGHHTFKWEYVKDPGCCTGGSDCAWIDNIRIYSSVE